MLSKGLHDDQILLFDEHHPLHIPTTVIITNNFKELFIIINSQLCNNNYSSCYIEIMFHRVFPYTLQTFKLLQLLVNCLMSLAKIALNL